ncbi:uncharacterized protein LOC112051970 [Bicyclus anynana]|uniref:Uncharacterized protein LOC112051970 n=1 Tax=Bicyclus anynana TaxID=110368 RepID=A0A6J1NI31_BICAN|nr:uncharacterized protein LOC112051970 [Bicyclus anynana]
MAKFTQEHHAGKSIKKQNGLTMFASTPLEVSKIETKAPAMFSSLTKLPTPITVKRNTQHPIIKARKLTFDDGEDSDNMDGESKLENSPENLSSVTKVTTVETIKRRRLQRTNLVGKRLFVDKDEQNNVECSTKDTTSNRDISKVLTPLHTPKRDCISKRGMNARRLTFRDAENEDFSPVKLFSNDFLPSEEKLHTPESMDWSSSRVMVLNVGIFIRPIRDNSK